MNKLARENLLSQFIIIDMSTCKYCLVGKKEKKTFEKGTKAQTPLQLIHFDIYSPISVKSRHDALYFITFINDLTYYGHVSLISYKLEALDCFKRYINLVKNQLDKKIKTLITYWGREHISKQLKDLCDENGISRQLTILWTPQQNDVTEKRNKMLLDMLKKMMTQENLLISYQGDALLITTYVLNQVPSKFVTSTPYELWNNQKSDLSNLRP